MLELELVDPVDVELLPVLPDVPELDIPEPDEELPDDELPELPELLVVELDAPEVPPELDVELPPSLTLVDVPDFSSLASFFTNTTD